MKPLAPAAAGRGAGADAVAPAAGRLRGPGWEAAARRRQRGRVLGSPGGPGARPLAGLAAPGGNLRLQVPAPAAGPGGHPLGAGAGLPLLCTETRLRPLLAGADAAEGRGQRGPLALGAGRGEPLGASARFLGDLFVFRRVGFPSW